MSKSEPHEVVSTSGNPMKCTAKTKKGTPCRQWALVGLDKCKHHCGLSKAELERIDTARARIARHAKTKRRSAEEAAHTKAECALRDHPSLGRYLRQTAAGPAAPRPWWPHLHEALSGSPG